MLLLLFLMLFSRSDEQPKCPMLLNEVIEQREYRVYLNGVELPNQESQVSYSTSTLSFKATYKFKNERGETMIINAGDRLELRSKVISTTTDKQAVEHNKKVKECQIINGEF